MTMEASDKIWWLGFQTDFLEICDLQPLFQKEVAYISECLGQTPLVNFLFFLPPRDWSIWHTWDPSILELEGKLSHPGFICRLDKGLGFSNRLLAQLVKITFFINSPDGLDH